MKKNEKQVVYVIGHINPDTDSICSAIAYAHLKNQISEAEHIPRSAGLLNEETHYVLDRFGVDTPKLLSNSYLKVRDVDVNTIPGISSNTSIKEAWATMKEQNVYTIAVTRDDELEGVISTGDIATSYMDVYDNEILSNARTQYQNIVNTLDGKIITGNAHAHFVKGKVVVAASSPDFMEKIIRNDDLVILGNRYEVQLCAIELNVSCMIVCLNAPISKTILKLAEERDIVVISTPHDAFTAARLINQSIPVKYFMNSKENLTVFNTKDNVEEIKGIITSKRTRDFPVLDDNGKYYGFISSRRLMEASKRKVILVDHNEKTQAVDGIEQADILEIIDHHRLGGIETLGPVYFRNQPVGCTATIVYSLYKENHIVPDKTIASLLCAAIISDTLFFRSPTCTLVDEYTAKELAQIAELDLKELAANMFKAGSDLRGKSAEEICYQDFKQFAAGDVKFGVGQVNCMSGEEIEELKAVMVPYLEQVVKKQKLDMVFFMLTNVMEVGTELLCCGKNAKELALQAFKLPENTENIYLQDVVSRKKQLIPAFVVSLQH